MLTIIPAIDLKGGKCVRLRRGRADDMVVYSDDPVTVASRWRDEGAQYLHIVDLDGAFEGRPAHADIIASVVSSVGIPVEVGGGLRTDHAIRAVLNAGADRAIVGTRALSSVDSLGDLVGRFGDRIAVGIDARDGMVQVRGWVETTEVRAVDLAGEADRAGVRTLICTDTDRDGMLKGVNAPAVGEICRAVACSVIASGGISSVNDVRALRCLQQSNLDGAIVGKALYDGTVTLHDLVEAGRR